MIGKLIVLFTSIILLFNGCSLKQDSIKEQNINTEQESVENLSLAEKTLDYHMEEDIAPHITGMVYSVNKEFKQGEVTTTVRDILVYSESKDSENYVAIEFNLNTKNGTGKDIYMVYDISPIVLNTGEQIDYADKCDIHRVFKGVTKDGRLVYRVNSKIEDIKTLRWVLASPMYNGTQLIGQECDFTFILDEYERAELK